MNYGEYQSTQVAKAAGSKTKIQTDAFGNLKTASAGSGATADQVQGTAASGAAVSGNPVQVGGRADTGAPTAVATGQAIPLWMGSRGQAYTSVVDGSGNGPVTLWADNGDAIAVSGGLNKLNVLGYNLNFDGTQWVRTRGDTNGAVVQPALSATFWQYAAAAGGIVSSTADVVLKAAGAAGVRNFLSSLTIQHDTLSAVTEFVIKDGAAIIYRGKLQTAANETGFTIQFAVPLRGTAATALNFALLTSVTGGVFVNAQGYTGS